MRYGRGSWRVAVLGLSVALLAQAVAEAQPGGRRPGGPGGFPGGFGGFGGGSGFGGMSKGLLLRAEQVQKELGIDADQQKKVDEVLTAARERVGRPDFGGFRDLSEEDRRKRMEEMRAKFTEQAAALDKDLSGVLSETQAKRLDEIVLQQRGISALQDAKIAEKLGLSAAQKESLSDVFAAQREMTQELFSGIRDAKPEERREKFEEIQKKTGELRTETEKAALKVLDDSQKTKFDELKGKAFELDRSQLFRGFGPRPDGEGVRRRPGGNQPAT